MRLVRFYGRTISYHHKIFVESTKQCNDLNQCDGSLNPMFSFSSISHFTRQYYWGASARYTVVYEHKGWFTGATTNMVTDSNFIIYQRPAL